MSKSLTDALKREKLMAIIRGVESKDILPTVTALVRGGMSVVEVTYNQKDKRSWKDTADAISLIKKSFEGIYVGAGTVISIEQLLLAKDAGAEFIVSPHTDTDLIVRTKKENLISVPGAFTPSECAAAYNAGADFVKLFPAGDLGPGYLKAIVSPLSHIPFLCVGGVNLDNIPLFLKNGATGFGIGSNLVDLNIIRQGEFCKLEKLAAEYVNVIKNCNKEGEV